jgi:nuclease-like protein
MFSVMLNLSGAPRYDMGAGAERWTSKELRRFGRPWRVIDGVEFENSDIDHVLIGPGGIFAVETKWSGYECDLDGGILPLGIEYGIQQTIASARKARLLLLSKKVHVEVQPILMVWGPRVREVSQGFVDIGSVRLVRGAQAGSWRSTLERVGAIDGPEIQGAVNGIMDYVRAHEPHELRPTSAFRRRQSA